LFSKDSIAESECWTLGIGSRNEYLEDSMAESECWTLGIGSR
jgi:hypothetical protein